MNYDLSTGEIATLVALCWGFLLLYLCAFMHGVNNTTISTQTRNNVIDDVQSAARRR